MKIIIILIIALLGMALVLLNNESQKNEVKETMTTKQMMYIVMFSALATVLGFFEIPLGISGAKFDFSEVIVLIAFYVLGFKKVSIVIILRSVIRFVFMPAKNPMEAASPIWKIFGEIIAIVASYLIITTYIAVKKMLRKEEKPLIVAVPSETYKVSAVEWITLPTVTALVLAGVLTIFHFFITVPVWNNVFVDSDMFTSKDFLGIIAFILAEFGVLNLIKGVLTPVIFLLVKPQITQIIK